MFKYWYIESLIIIVIVIIIKVKFLHWRAKDFFSGILFSAAAVVIYLIFRSLSVLSGCN